MKESKKHVFMKAYSTFAAALYLIFGQMVVYASGTATKGSQWLDTVKNIGVAIVGALGAIVLLYGIVKVAIALITKQPGDIVNQVSIIAAGGLMVGIATVLSLFT